MAADTIKSASITALDTVPVNVLNAGEGGPGEVRNASDFFTPTAAGLKDTGSTYRAVRLPSNAKLKSLRAFVETALDSGSPALAWDVGLYYSDSTVDGTSAANSGASISANLFLAATVGYAQGEFDAAATFPAAARTKPLWQAAGLASDPGGYFDVVFAVHTAGSASAASHPVAVSADYVVGQ